MLRETAEDLGDAGWDTWYGYGLVNALEAAGTAPEPPVLTTIKISPSDATLFISEKQKFTATGVDQYGDSIATGPITWISSNETVGTIDENGLCIAVGIGETTITATGDGGVFVMVTITVVEIPILSEIQVSPDSVTLHVDEEKQFTVTGIDQYGESIATGLIIWTSSDETVGIIGQDGLFKAVSLGDVTITATDDGNVVGTASVSVVEVPILSEIQVSPDSVTLYVNEDQQFTAAGMDQYGDSIATGAITWASSDETVGTIDESGLFTALDVGETTITATGNGSIVGTAVVTVQAEPAGPDEFTFAGIIFPRQELKHSVSVSEPAAMNVHLTWRGHGDLQLRIYDPDGIMVAESDSSTWRNQVEKIMIDVNPGDWQIAVRSNFRRWPVNYTVEGTLSY